MKPLRFKQYGYLFYCCVVKITPLDKVKKTLTWIIFMCSDVKKLSESKCFQQVAVRSKHKGGVVFGPRGAIKIMRTRIRQEPRTQMEPTHGRLVAYK